MSERPKYDPAELAREGLAEEEAEGIRLALEELDRGEGVPGPQVFEEIREELQALAEIEARRARRTG